MMTLDFPSNAFGSPVALRRDLLLAGYSDDEIARAVRTGAAERLCHGAVGLATPLTDPNAEFDRYRNTTVVRALRLRSCVISHLSAAAIHRLPIYRGDTDFVHVTRPHRGGARRGRGLVQHSARLTDADVVRVGAYRVTSVARTLLDVGRSESLQTAVVMADAALQQGLVTPGVVEEVVNRQSGTPGMHRARRALSLVDGRSESVGESLTRLVFRKIGIVLNDLQVEVRADGGELLGRVDAALLDDGVLVEFDGRIKYQRYRRAGESITDMVLREKRREESLVDAGYVVLRLVWADLFDLAKLRARVERAIRAGRRNRSAENIVGGAKPRAALRLCS